MLAHETGVFVAPPGVGKTVVGAHLVAKRERNTLVIVHRTPLLDQWRAQLGVFLDLDPAQIGQVGGGRRKPKGVVDVAMIQSLVRRGEVDPIAWKGTLVQYAGRLHRRHQGKTEVRIYDYVDEAVPVLDRMFEKRLRGYRAMGYEIDRSDSSSASAGREYVIEYEEDGTKSSDPDPF